MKKRASHTAALQKLTDSFLKIFVWYLKWLMLVMTCFLFALFLMSSQTKADEKNDIKQKKHQALSYEQCREFRKPIRFSSSQQELGRILSEIFSESIELSQWDRVEDVQLAALDALVAYKICAPEISTD